MDITIIRTGGLAGVRQILGPVATHTLSDSEKIDRLVEQMDFFNLPPQIPSAGGADVFFYTTIITTTNPVAVLAPLTNTVRSDDLSDEPYHGQLGELIALLRDAGSDFADQTPGQDIDWNQVRVIPAFVDGFVVVVDGIAPVPTAVSFEPEVTEQLLDYAPVHVVGRRASVALEVETPWTIESPLEQLPHGPKGTVLVGATKRRYIPAHDRAPAVPY